MFKTLTIGIWALLIVALLIAAKYLIHALGMEFFSINALLPSAIGGAIFIIGFLLSGIIADHKEAEMRSSLESIWEEGKHFNGGGNGFDLAKLRDDVAAVARAFLKGLGHEGEHHKTMNVLSAECELPIVR